MLLKLKHVFATQDEKKEFLTGLFSAFISNEKHPLVRLLAEDRCKIQILLMNEDPVLIRPLATLPLDKIALDDLWSYTFNDDVIIVQFVESEDIPVR